MPHQKPKIIDSTDEKGRTTFRRLLLSRQLYLHGLDHSGRAGALNKMIAIHNFHNAIEITLKSILLHYEIRSDKQLNIEFETMLSEIDNHKSFKDKGLKLPYRQEVRNLNQLRNLVQHHATEPESTMMEDWRVFVRRFLQQACDVYFGVRFEDISPLDMISSDHLKELLRLSLVGLEAGDFKRSIILSKAAFEWAL